ncbi:MAG: endolytic transglycosylase MltG [Sphingomonas sp.]|uniref:endolytic transglycosylase MltG n=1 Tax=Sphingomonas sp. TaxID=28214 RepID=UPI0012065CB5|nr:endolytic transglycosylase MltG [Sphingomonas sp.]THD36680.1 MAG: endolytic transglycosylase MltG [Sphingomonas sp.]
MRRFGCLTLFTALALVGGALWAIHDWGGAGPAPKNLTVTIQPGSGLSKAADQLEAAGAIRSASRFVFFAKIFGGGTGIRAGEYGILAHLSQSDILKLLQGGKTLQRFVTIPEGLPSILAQERIMAAPELIGTIDRPAEGSLLPDSYSYQRGDTRQSVVNRMQRAMQAYLAKAWASRKPGLVVHTPQEAIILASIVEKETAVPSERRMVAAVYSNRLKRGMMLQADPTIIYPVTLGKALGRRILLSEKNAKNAYNTYTMTGLPKGPIANPGRASIDAVLNPADSNALYFVADGTGGSVFADTLEQQNINVQKWYAIRRARGEM